MRSNETTICFCYHNWVRFIAFTQDIRISANDLKSLEGKQWVGNLTYLDYRSSKKVSIPSNLTVTRSKSDPLIWTFDFHYPDEPKANGKSEYKLSHDGKVFNDGNIIEKRKLSGGIIKILISKAGTDNDKPAVFHYTYMIGRKSFSIKKEVRAEGSTDFFERNTYNWTR